MCTCVKCTTQTSWYTVAICLKYILPLLNFVWDLFPHNWMRLSWISGSFWSHISLLQCVWHFYVISAVLVHIWSNSSGFKLVVVNNNTKWNLKYIKTAANSLAEVRLKTMRMQSRPTPKDESCLSHAYSYTRIHVSSHNLNTCKKPTRFSFRVLEESPFHWIERPFIRNKLASYRHKQNSAKVQ